MARRRKLKKIAEAMTFPNVRQADTTHPGTWPEYFGNSHPIVLELACGTGAYAVGLARMFPENNFIGVDIKGARIWSGAKTALELKLPNAAFLRAPIENLKEYFLPGSVAGIWITFPDPFPRKKHAKNRLTSPKFLDIYKAILAPGGIIHLKTDDKFLFDYATETATSCQGEILEKIEDLYAREITDPTIKIKTKYEQRHVADGRRIYYLSFVFERGTQTR